MSGGYGMTYLRASSGRSRFHKSGDKPRTRNEPASYPVDIPSIAELPPDFVAVGAEWFGNPSGGERCSGEVRDRTRHHDATVRFRGVLYAQTDRGGDAVVC
jgi:hypothetical protein